MPAVRLVTDRQLNVLVEYMEENRDFALGHLMSSANGRRQTHQQWEELAARLNSTSGITKTVMKWRDFWSERKYAVKKKCLMLRRHAQENGSEGGPPSRWKLTKLEERILAIMGKVVVKKLETQHPPTSPDPPTQLTPSPPPTPPSPPEACSLQDSTPSSSRMEIVIMDPLLIDTSGPFELMHHTYAQPGPHIVASPVATATTTAASLPLFATTSRTRHIMPEPIKETKEVPQYAPDADQKKCAAEEQARSSESVAESLASMSASIASMSGLMSSTTGSMASMSGLVSSTSGSIASMSGSMASMSSAIASMSGSMASIAATLARLDRRTERIVELLERKFAT